MDSRRAGCCGPCPICTEMGKKTPRQYSVEFEDIDLCTDCTCHVAPPGSDHCYKWTQTPGTGPNGTFALDRASVVCSGSRSARCTWRYSADCDTGILSKWDAQDCSGPADETAEVDSFHVEIEVFSAEDGGTTYRWATLKAWYEGCEDGLGGAGVIWAFTAVTWDGDPETYVEMDCRDFGPLGNLEGCLAASSQLIGDCVAGGAAENGTGEAVAVFS